LHRNADVNAGREGSQPDSCHSSNGVGSQKTAIPNPEYEIQNIEIIDLTGGLAKPEEKSFGEAKGTGKSPGPQGERAFLSSPIMQQRGRKRHSDSYICNTSQQRDLKRPSLLESREPAKLGDGSPTQFFLDNQALRCAVGYTDFDNIVRSDNRPLQEREDCRNGRTISAATDGFNDRNAVDENAEDLLLMAESESVCRPEHTGTTRPKRLEDNAERVQDVSESLVETDIAALMSSYADPVGENAAISDVEYCPPWGYKSLPDECFGSHLEASLSRIDELCSGLKTARLLNSEIVYQQAMSVEGHVDMNLVAENKSLTVRIEALESLQRLRTVYLACAASQANLRRALVKNTSQGRKRPTDSEMLARYNASTAQLERIKAELCELLRVAEIPLQQLLLDFRPLYAFPSLVL
jgi:bloom syndrome protein